MSGEDIIGRARADIVAGSLPVYRLPHHRAHRYGRTLYVAYLLRPNGDRYPVHARPNPRRRAP